MSLNSLDLSYLPTAHFSDAPPENPMEYQLPSHAKLTFKPGELADKLASYITTQRNERFQNVLAQRSRHVVPIFEDTYHNHNVSAVLRTLEALGFQDVLFLYEQDKAFQRHKDDVERGTSLWLTPRRARSRETLISTLKKSHYKIFLVTAPTFDITGQQFNTSLPHWRIHEASCSPQFLNILEQHKIALVFGNEAQGVHALWHTEADGYLSIAMHGFVESLNLSVCAGILMHTLRQILDKTLGCKHLLLSHERHILHDLWVARMLLKKPHVLAPQNTPEQGLYVRWLLEERFFVPFGYHGMRVGMLCE